jgi:hypothetical protein
LMLGFALLKSPEHIGATIPRPGRSRWTYEQMAVEL